MNGNITVNDIENQKSRAIQEKIAYILLKDTNNLNNFKASEVQEVKLYSGNILGEGKSDLLVTAKFGPTITLAGVYTPTENGYVFVDDIGPFATITDVELKPNDVFKRDLVVIREFSNQNIGAFEEALLFRGYLYNEKTGKFDEIFKVPESQKANWNKLWDSPDPTGKSLWERVVGYVDVETLFNDSGPDTIRVKQHQEYLVSADTASKSVPGDRTYSVIKERDFIRDYTWSNKWRRFIIGEAKDKRNGEIVAILEDYGDSAYALVPEYESFNYLYKILRPNGMEEVVSKNNVLQL